MDIKTKNLKALLNEALEEIETENKINNKELENKDYKALLHINEIIDNSIKSSYKEGITVFNLTNYLYNTGENLDYLIPPCNNIKKMLIKKEIQFTQIDNELILNISEETLSADEIKVKYYSIEKEANMQILKKALIIVLALLVVTSVTKISTSSPAIGYFANITMAITLVYLLLLLSLLVINYIKFLLKILMLSKTKDKH